MFDKAEEAEQIEDLVARHRSLKEQIGALEEESKTTEAEQERTALAGRIEKLEEAYEQLGLIIERARQSHDES